MTEISLDHLFSHWEPDREGATLYQSVAALYPICRSITGDGVRESLGLLRSYAPLSLHEIPSGTKVFDWEVPKEWNIRDAYISDASGRKVVDFRRSNLHIVNYSVPVHRKMSLAELRPHLFTLPDLPEWIPYRTSYYKETWGFCLSQRDYDALTEQEYEVHIDSTLKPGHLTYGEFRIQGAVDDEILISAHSCHPSLCNDNLSGMVIAARLAQILATLPLRYSYRFIWAPGTIGSITWLAMNETQLGKIKHGLVLSCLGDGGQFTYKRSRRGNSEIDQVVEHVLQHSERAYQIRDFAPVGYDERQYCSPGINLPVGCFMRTPNGAYPQYHTSADNLNLVEPLSLAGSLKQLLTIVATLEDNRTYRNLNPRCEPQLGKRGLYSLVGGLKNAPIEEAILWVLNFSDGAHSLLDIAQRANLPFKALATAAELLKKSGLIVEAT